MEESTEKSASSKFVTSGPVVTKAMFSEITGLRPDIVRGMVERGQLPSVKIGKHRMINLARLTSDVLESEY
jgi:hypothetical protein